MTPEAVAPTLDAMASRVLSRHLSGPEAAATLKHEAMLIRQNEREEREHRATCRECRLPEPVEETRLTG